jgi:predicted molibdopterin-dependent oxidoreductase YjgC
MDITPLPDLDLSSLKFLYTMVGDAIKIDTLEFLVVQDTFPGEYMKKADVVLPSAVWIEYEGTYISSDYRVNLVKKAINPTGETKPPWWIFRELAKKMEQSWDSKNNREIWEKEIILKDPNLLKINYEQLENGGVKIAGKPPFSIDGPFNLPGGYQRINIQKILCTFCEDLKDVVDKRIKEGD